MHYPASLYLTLHRTLYVMFGPPNIGPFIELGAILAAWVLTFVARKQRPSFWLTLAGAASLAIGLAVYFSLIEPANVALSRIAIDAPPVDWTRWRDQWEYGHAAHFVFHLLGFSMLTLSVLVQSTQNSATLRHVPQAREPRIQSAG